MKAVRPIIASSGVPYLQIRSVGSHVRKGGGRKAVLQINKCCITALLLFSCAMINVEKELNYEIELSERSPGGITVNVRNS